jgi:DNA mismatch repair protein MutS2
VESVAISELDSFIDKALLSNTEELEVVHGKGTGALRREIHSYLKNAPAVASFRLAPADLGGDGMTIVELR